MKFNISQLAQILEDNCPEAYFALLHGSAKDGNVEQGSDVDIAVHLNCKPTLEIYQRIIESAEAVVPNIKVDVGILNNCEPIYRFETLKGKLLFVRDKEKYLNFYSLTCREYEDQIADYQRQQKYRLECTLKGSKFSR